MLFELQATPLGRRRVFVRAQLPLLLSTAFIGISTAIALPETFGSLMVLLGLAVVALASLAAVLLPWERWHAAWMIAVPVTDIVGVTLMRTELIYIVPSVGLLVAFPVLWLAYGFRRQVILVAIAGACFVSTFPFVYRGAWPADGTEWLNVITLPVLIIGLAMAVNYAARELGIKAEKLTAANRVQALTYRRALDNEILARSILDTVNAGVAFYSSDNELLLSNQLARGMTRAVGFELDQPPYGGDQVLAADRATPIAIEDQIIPRALRGELIEDHMEWLGPPEAQVAILASSRPVHREDGALLGTVVMAYDITELAAAIAVREEFLGTVSHELRTPLTSVLGYLELVADDLDPSQTDALLYLDIVRRNMSNLTDRITDMLGAAATDIHLTTRSTDIVALVATSVENAAGRAAARGISLENTTRGSVTAVVDAARIGQAVDELLANAIKFSPAGSTVTVSHTTDGDGVHISVADDGPSMTRAEQTRVFDRFYRTQYARDQAVQGFGLGLFVVKNIVTAHGGQVSIHGEPGVGTRMTLSVPVSGVPDAAADPVPQMLKASARTA
jgi:signal transduction histidine kinase